MLRRNQVLHSLGKIPAETDRREVLYATMRESKALRRDLEHHELAAEGAPERSLSFLWTSVPSYADQQIRDRNEHDVDSELIGRPAAPGHQGWWGEVGGSNPFAGFPETETAEKARTAPPVAA